MSRSQSIHDGILKRVRLALVLGAVGALGPVSPARVCAAVRPPLRVDGGAVATDHPLASAAGVELLRRGANAVDAACAAAFALGVVQPAGSGIGGGGFMLIKRAGEAQVVALDFRESAPAGAKRALYAANAERAGSGGLAVGVPGEVMGCAEAVKRHGKVPLRTVLAPAIRLARGFETGAYLAELLKRREATFARDPQLVRVFKRTTTKAPAPRVPRAGERVKRELLARTLTAIAKGGPQVFYRGWIARDIVDTVRAAGGILSLEDLADYQVRWREPLELHFAGHEIYLMPPPSSAGIVLTEVLNVLRRHDVTSLGHNGSAYLHLLVEALKHAFADRARLLGDADFVSLPLARLTSQAYADALDRRINERTLPTLDYGDSPNRPAPKARDGGTSHISVIDRDGMAVALTTSINTEFGSGLVGERSGIILNNTMADFALQPGKPNVFGLIQGEANAVAPGKRPLSSMAPTIVCRDGVAKIALGGSGGPTIISATLQVLLNVLVFRQDAEDAVSRPRVHHQWLPDVLWLEQDLPRDVADNLRRRGHTVKWVTRPPLPHTAVQLVIATEGQEAASDPRKLGTAAGAP